jgi:molybdopterin synthase catalytic subunit
MISISSEPIDVCKILVDIMDSSAGGIALFVGSVRDHNKDEVVSEIYYEAYKEMAEENLAQIENGARKTWSIKKFLAVHRIGNLKVGDVSVAVAISAEHRKDAFEACKYAIDEIKVRLPIWKKEVSESGAYWAEGISLQKSDSAW